MVIRVVTKGEFSVVIILRKAPASFKPPCGLKDSVLGGSTCG